MNILGLNAYHGDAAAALVVDGQLVAAVEEERFNRIKHWAGFPSQSIQYCLDVAGIGIEDVDHVAISFNPRANMAKRLMFVARHRPSFNAVLARLKRQGKTLGLEDQLAAGLGVERSRVRAKFHRIEHHQTHLAAGFLISPFDQAAILSVDGMGDFTSTLTAFAQGRGWQELDRVYFPHSIGYLYTAITMYLGFPYYGDEYKVMGLAPYGEPEYLDFFRKLIKPKKNTFELNLDYFTHHKSGIQMTWNNGAMVIEPFVSQRLEKELGPFLNGDVRSTACREHLKSFAAKHHMPLLLGNKEARTFYPLSFLHKPLPPTLPRPPCGQTFEGRFCTVGKSFFILSLAKRFHYPKPTQPEGK